MQNISTYRGICCLQRTHTTQLAKAPKPKTLINQSINWDIKFTLSIGATDPSLMVKISESERDWEVWPCWRKSGPCWSKSLAIRSYKADLCSLLETIESGRKMLNKNPISREPNRKSERVKESNWIYQKQMCNCVKNQSSGAPFGIESRRARQRRARGKLRFWSDSCHYVTATTQLISTI